MTRVKLFTTKKNNYQNKIIMAKTSLESP